jgi:hypothetical protein
MVKEILLVVVFIAVILFVSVPDPLKFEMNG